MGSVAIWWVDGCVLARSRSCSYVRNDADIAAAKLRHEINTEYLNVC